MHEQTAVTGEQRAIFSCHDFEQPAIVGVSFVSGVEAEQPQVTCELAQVPIGDETAPRSDLKARRNRHKIRVALKTPKISKRIGVCTGQPKSTVVRRCVCPLQQSSSPPDVAPRMPRSRLSLQSFSDSIRRMKFLARKSRRRNAVRSAEKVSLTSNIAKVVRARLRAFVRTQTWIANE
jgi:hypothetical protein